MGAGWRRFTEKARQKWHITADKGFASSSNARNELMLRDAGEFAGHIKRCEKDIRILKNATEGLINTTKAVMSAPLPKVYEDCGNGTAQPIATTQGLSGAIGGDFKVDELQRVSKETAKKLEAEVLAPMQRWTTAYNTVQARMNKLEGVRLEVDSRRRTVAELGQKIDKQRARLPQTKSKGEFDIEQTIKKVPPESMDEPGNSGDDPLSPRGTYTRQHVSHRRQSDADRVLPAQLQHQQPSRTLTVPAQLAAAFPTWSREAADTLFGLLERGDQAAAISEAFSGVSFPAALAGAGRSSASPQAGQHQSGHQLQQASALQQQLQQQQLQRGLQRRNDDQPSSVLPNEPFVPAGTDTHSLLAQYQLQAQQLAAAPRPRWKPNAAQIGLLEQHFSAGHTKPTPELTSAVQQAGSATEQQVVVWLKNRLARAKRDAKDSKETTSAQQNPLHQTHSSDRAESGRKRSRSDEEEGDNSEAEEENMPVDFHGIVNLALRETRNILEEVSPEVVAGLRGALRRAGQVCCYGPGREGLVLKAFATRLHQLGIKASTVGDSCSGAVGGGDLVLISAGPSYYASVNMVASEARRAGARVVAFTAHRTAPLPFADTVVRLPAQAPISPTHPKSFAGGSAEPAQLLVNNSVLPMGSAYEMALQLLLDTIALMLQQENNVTEELMKSRLSNLE